MNHDKTVASVLPHTGRCLLVLLSLIRIAGTITVLQV